MAKIFGYSFSAFNRWIEKDADDKVKARFEWLKMSAVLVVNGYTPVRVLCAINENEKLHKQVSKQKNEIKKVKSEIEEMVSHIKSKFKVED